MQHDKQQKFFLNVMQYAKSIGDLKNLRSPMKNVSKNIVDNNLTIYQRDVAA